MIGIRRTNKGAKKEALVDKQVMEVLNVIKNAVRAGQSLQNAIVAAKNELKYPIKRNHQNFLNQIEKQS